MRIPDDLALFEAGAVAAAVVVAWKWPRPGASLWSGARGTCSALRGAPALIGCALLAGAACAALGALLGGFEPRVHDEFSYLLLADTLREGRLANPTHPLWEHFETFHVLHEPTYASKFPPGQGALLALGDALGGDPRVGVWLGVSLLGAAITWMLRGWMSPRWALLGGGLAVLQLGLGSYWSHAFWGGALAATGGALAFGGFRRLQTSRGLLLPASALGAGLVLLAVSRPWEGVLASLPLAVAFVAWTIGRLRAGALGRALVATAILGAVLSAGAFGLATYHRAVTGDPLRMPYAEHEGRYAVAPPFLWQDLRESPGYSAPEIERFYTGFCTEGWAARRSLRGWLVGGWLKAKLYGWFFVGVLLGIPMLLSVRAWRRREFVLPLAACTLVFGAQLATTWELPHYAAPASGPVALFVLLGLRRLAGWRCGGRRVGSALAGLTLVLLAFFTPLRARSALTFPVDWHLRRAAAQRGLVERGGRHVVFVRYDGDHSPHREWVYNAADIDASPVVWARDQGPARNQAVLDYYPNRTAWLVPVSFSAHPEEPTPYAR